METQYAAAIAFASALLIAAFTAMFAYVRYIREQEHQRRTLLNALFAELANILEHCAYAAAELPTDPMETSELKKRLQWSKYGSLRSASDVTRMGFLDASSIKALLQLELRLRNDGLLLDQMLKDLVEITEPNLWDMRGRLVRRVADVSWLLNQLVTKRPELKSTLKNIEKELPILP